MADSTREPAAVAGEGQVVRALTASDFVLLALLVVVIVYVLPSKLIRWMRRSAAAGRAKTA